MAHGFSVPGFVLKVSKPSTGLGFGYGEPGSKPRFLALAVRFDIVNAEPNCPRLQPCLYLVGIPQYSCCTLRYLDKPVAIGVLLA